MINNRILKLDQNFEIDFNHKLGQGSSGCVYLGKQLKTKQIIAIKVIDLNTINNQVLNYLIKMESIALRSFNHDNLLKCFKILEIDNKIFMITQYYNGNTLSQYIKNQGPINQLKTLQILYGILEGYQELINKQIYHRDIKTSNIMLHNGIPKIIDFGYCQVQGYSKPSRKYNVGSPCYMAPQTISENICNEKSQIWSLGVILFQCLAGRTLHDGRISIPQALDNIKNYGIFYPPYISRACQQLINSCLTFNPNYRPSCFQLKQKIQKLININKKLNYPLGYSIMKSQEINIKNPQKQTPNNQLNKCHSNNLLQKIIYDYPSSRNPRNLQKDTNRIYRGTMTSNQPKDSPICYNKISRYNSDLDNYKNLFQKIEINDNYLQKYKQTLSYQNYNTNNIQRLR